MSVYICRRCEYQAPTLWEGPCPQCAGWYRAKKVGVDNTDQKNRSTFAAAHTSTREYIPTGVKGVDEVLGGGLVAGSVILFAGFRGAGKSTLLTEVVDSLSSRRKCCYASSEQSVEGVVDIAHRVGARSDSVLVLGDQKNIEQTLETVKSERVFLTVYDSLQKFVSLKSSGMMGSANQGTTVAAAIKDDCRTRKTCAIVVNQMARSGELKGGSDVEHDLDTIMVLAYPQPGDEDAPGDESDGIRMLICDKNRNGPETLKTYWEMSPEGRMVQVEARSKLIQFPRNR